MDNNYIQSKNLAVTNHQITNQIQNTENKLFPCLFPKTKGIQLRELKVLIVDTMILKSSDFGAISEEDQKINFNSTSTFKYSFHYNFNDLMNLILDIEEKFNIVDEEGNDTNYVLSLTSGIGVSSIYTINDLLSTIISKITEIENLAFNYGLNYRVILKEVYRKPKFG